MCPSSSSPVCSEPAASHPVQPHSVLEGTLGRTAAEPSPRLLRDCSSGLPRILQCLLKPRMGGKEGKLFQDAPGQRAAGSRAAGSAQP